jgi:hypothetical protein
MKRGQKELMQAIKEVQKRPPLIRYCPPNIKIEVDSPATSKSTNKPNTSQ